MGALDRLGTFWGRGRIACKGSVTLSRTFPQEFSDRSRTFPLDQLRTRAKKGWYVVAPYLLCYRCWPFCCLHLFLCDRNSSTNAHMPCEEDEYDENDCDSLSG